MTLVLPRGVVKDNEIAIVHYEYEDGKPTRLIGTHTKIGDPHWTKLESIDEAEKIILNLNYSVGGAYTITETETDIYAVAVLINKAANDIAKNCRRGAGNTVMYHPKLASIVENSRNLSNFFYSTYKFIENEHCPEDYIVVLYQGSEQTDQPFVYTDEDDELHLFSNNLGKDVTNYGQKVKIIT